MKPHHRILFLQFVLALSMGALLAAADLQLQLGLTEGQLGFLLVAMSAGALFGLTFSIRLVERLGARITAFVTIFGASALFALIPWIIPLSWRRRCSLWPAFSQEPSRSTSISKPTGTRPCLAIAL